VIYASDDWLVKYIVLTAAIFLPLVCAFLFVRNVYPFTAWNVMMAGGDLERGAQLLHLRGETISGETVDIRPIELTNALYSRTWTMVNATIDNQSFKLNSIHPRKRGDVAPGWRDRESSTRRTSA
jgi:hypothetical protein